MKILAVLVLLVMLSCDKLSPYPIYLNKTIIIEAGSNQMGWQLVLIISDDEDRANPEETIYSLDIGESVIDTLQVPYDRLVTLTHRIFKGKIEGMHVYYSLYQERYENEKQILECYVAEGCLVGAGVSLRTRQ